MKIEVKEVANWGNYPSIRAEIVQPEQAFEAVAYVQKATRLIARGNGKCYGDAALGPMILSTLALRTIRSFDASAGQIDCEAGVLLSDLLPLIVPAGWFFHVTPGIKSITVGGAIASDVHGKNHPAKGCFSNWLISLELLQGDGTIARCSRMENAPLFWQTCGGMGWTGVILSACFRLMKISSTQMRQMSLRASNLEQLFRIFEENAHWPYAAGWIDCTARGAGFGRGAVFFAAHATAPEENQTLQFLTKKAKNVPFFAPSWVLNRFSIYLHNALFNRRVQAGESLVELDTYFYPLDRVQNWNRFYGRRGFIQYQFCLPEEQSFDGIREVLETIRSSRDTPFLTVLKRHGERPPEAIHSFPIRGYSLALDFPRTSTIFDLVKRLDEIVWQHGGKIYLSKDACSSAKMGRVDPRTFGEDKFFSSLKERIMMK